MTSIVFFSIGNPGKMARHSVGHHVLKKICDSMGAKQLVKKGKYSISQMDQVYFVKSNAYMNESGILIRSFFQNEKIGSCVVIIIFDDFELLLPKVRIQPFKKNESHNGVKAVSKELDSLDISGYKLGVGIGPKPQNASKDSMAAWVLSDFKPDEKLALSTSMDYVYKFVDVIISLDGELGDCGRLTSRVTKAMKAELLRSETPPDLK